MAAPPPTTLPGTTILSLGAALGAEPPEEVDETHFDNEHWADTLEQALMKRDKNHYTLGFERGFVAGMYVSMVAWVVVSLVSSLFGEHGTVVKGVMMGVYIFVLARSC